MKQRLLLLGVGMQGQAVLHDLASHLEFSRIVVADSRPDLEALASRYRAGKAVAVRVDARDASHLTGLIRESDVVVEALPGALALSMGQLAARCGVPLVSSMYYRSFEGLDSASAAAQRASIDDLDRLAQQRGITILTEFGMDPGLDLLMATKAISEFDEVHALHTYGAGLPAADARDNPLQYRFSWSPLGVMRAYSRPSRVIRDGQVVEIPADEIFEQRNCHTIDVPELGIPLECFANGDAVHYAGLLGIRHSLRESGRYTGRYPGHCAFWNTVVKSGLLASEPLGIAGAMISPAEFVAAALSRQRQFQYAGNERDLSFIRVEALGLRQGRPWHVVYQLIDYRDAATGFTAMQRTVGFTMSRGAQLIAAGKLTKPGVLTPLDVAYEDVLPALEPHGIRVQVRRGETAFKLAPDAGLRLT
jgi:saccharopine dehydrogenase-like NADP-dependent oxidoreductase